ncbi:MAG: carboxypeptidase-like regulatory domain-containing protein, partial [Xanthomonadales bacterium]|nr:carboxypeptidase-like regulatory domain-containing protein [Xanthomonadales bacterium]
MLHVSGSEKSPISTTFRQFPSRIAPPRQTWSGLGLGLALLTLPLLASADITGQVIRTDNLNPIQGASVRIQADESSPVVLTGADGRFTLPVNPTSSVAITATVTYDPASGDNFPIEQMFANNGDDILIQLRPLVGDNPNYQPPTASNGCSACHQEQVNQWQT